MRIGILAGEASGDILGSRILAALRERHDDLVVEGIGGPLMAEQGLQSMFPMERLSVMGFVEPAKRLPELLKIRGEVYRHFLADPPDVFLGIDSPDFNLHLEQKLRRARVRTAHLVSPTVWAWRAGRIRKIRRAVDLMLCLFPFETGIYREHHVPVRFVGHPLADEIPAVADRDAARASLGIGQEGAVVALLPGSRGGEMRMLGREFLEAATLLHRQHDAISFIVPAASPERRAEFAALLAEFPDLPVTLLDGRSREAMTAADVILLASGTATLEAALLKRPMVVAYRMAATSWALVKRLATTRFAALPNVLADEAVVPELLQEAATPQGMAAAVTRLLEEPDAARAQTDAFTAMHESLSRDYALEAARALEELAGIRHG